MSLQLNTDRYVSFCGIQCDLNAKRFMNLIEDSMQQGQGDARWCEYFRQKREQQARMQQDDLYFIGAQMNNLYAYIDTIGDESLHDMLWQIEQECC